jgi:hypothetical protein
MLITSRQKKLESGHGIIAAATRRLGKNPRLTLQQQAQQPVETKLDP